MSSLPDYHEHLVATHLAFKDEFAAVIRSLSLPLGAEVLDVACGDGFSTQLMADAFPAETQVRAIDKLPAYVQRAKKATQGVPRVHIAEGDAYQLDFPNGSIDLVLCAESLVSLGRRKAALTEMHRVLKSNGRIVVLEQDQAHDLILPWPPDLEIAIQQALLRHATRKGRDPFIARSLRAELTSVGFGNVSRRTIAADRAAPLDSDGRAFLKSSLERLQEMIAHDLPNNQGDRLAALADPDHDGSFVNRQDLELTYLFWVWTAGKP